ncbi:MAG: hypothetical protein GY754_37155 [bacterium]|nr:hypothetical protein [bacterium]
MCYTQEEKDRYNRLKRKKPRFMDLGYMHHIISRCRQLSPLIKTDELMTMMYEVIEMATNRFAFELVAFTIMNNEFEFVIRTYTEEQYEEIKKARDVKDEKICANSSQIVQYIKSVYAQRFNREKGETGVFWNERFCDKIVEFYEEPKEHLRTLLWDLGHIPVEEGLVEDPRHYKYSSIKFYLESDYDPPVPLVHHEYFIELGATFAERVRKFWEYEAEYREKTPAYFAFYPIRNGTVNGRARGIGGV